MVLDGNHTYVSAIETSVYMYIILLLWRCCVHVHVICMLFMVKYIDIDSGSEHGLSLRLNLENYENIEEVSTLSGVKVSVRVHIFSMK